MIRTPRIMNSMNLLELERCRELEMALDQDVVSSVVVLSFSQSVFACCATGEKRGGLLQFCEDAVESCAGAAGGGEGEPGSFVGHCGIGEVFYGGIRELAVGVAEAITTCEKKERRGEGVIL